MEGFSDVMIERFAICFINVIKKHHSDEQKALAVSKQTKKETLKMEDAKQQTKEKQSAKNVPKT